MSAGGRNDVTRRPNVGIVQKNAMMIAAIVAPFEVALPLRLLLVLARVARELARGSGIEVRLDGDGGDGHRISLCFLIWMTLNTMSGTTKRNSTTASAAECP